MSDFDWWYSRYSAVDGTTEAEQLEAEAQAQTAFEAAADQFRKGE
jgi:hypothetical protein